MVPVTEGGSDNRGGKREEKEGGGANRVSRMAVHVVVRERRGSGKKSVTHA